MEFEELYSEQWKCIKPFLPPQPITGRKRADDRKVIQWYPLCPDHWLQVE